MTTNSSSGLMRHFARLVFATFVTIAAFSLLIAPSAQAKKPSAKVEICHFKDSKVKLTSVTEDSLEDHLAHGDDYPLGDGSCDFPPEPFCIQADLGNFETKYYEAGYLPSTGEVTGVDFCVTGLDLTGSVRPIGFPGYSIFSSPSTFQFAVNDGTTLDLSGAGVSTDDTGEFVGTWQSGGSVSSDGAATYAFFDNICPEDSCVCPSGWTGQFCETVIDECKLGTDNCDANVACSNTAGSFSCERLGADPTATGAPTSATSQNEDSPSTTGEESSSAATDEEDSSALDLFKDKSKTFDFTATAGFESGLKKLAKLDGRLAGVSIPTVDWGDGTITRALFANCQGLLLNDCEVWGSHLYDKPGNYTVKVSVRLVGRTKKTIKPTGKAKVSPVRDFVIVSIGDSYYSGEGAPFKRLSALYNLSFQALWDEPSNYDSGPPWSSTSNGNFSKKTVEGLKTRSCHRSAISGPRIAGRMIAPVSKTDINEQNNNQITHIHMACSGAKVGYGAVKADDDFGSPIKTGDRDTFRYINEQLAWVRTRVPQIDVLLISGGGNNVGFINQVKGCLKIREDKNLKCPDENDSEGEDTERYFGPLKSDYEELADEIDCRSDKDFGALCASVQFTTEKELVPDAVAPSTLKNVSYSSSDGKRATTKGSKIDNHGYLNGCFSFLFNTNTATNTAPMKLSLRSVDVPISECGIRDQGLDNTIPFGKTMYLRSDLDGWNDVPGRGQRFINTGDGMLEAEFWIDWGDKEPRFKVASLEEMVIPGVSLINHYPDATRNKDGGDMTDLDLRLCTNVVATPEEWNDIHDFLVIPLRNTIDIAAKAHDWEVIKMGKAKKHGFCTKAGERWIVGPGQSLVRQGDLTGTAHPNEAGQRYYGDQIYNKMVKVTPPRTTATAITVDGEPYTFDTISSADVVVTLEAINPLADLADLEDSGIGETYYAVNDYTDAVMGSRCKFIDSDVADIYGAPSDGCILYEGPFTITEPGVHSVSFFTLNHKGKPERRVWPVTVEINREPPLMTCASSPQELWPPNGRMRTIEVSVTAEDEGDGTVDFMLAEILDSEDNVAEDVVGFDLGMPDVSGEMRSRRLGKGLGRTYTLVYESSDVDGNVASCSVEVVVPHDQRRLEK